MIGSLTGMPITESSTGVRRPLDPTPAAVLARVLPRWRARVSPRFSSAEVDDFVRGNWAALQALVTGALARRKAERGELPDTAVEFAAYDVLAARHRRRGDQRDRTVLAWLFVQIDQRIAAGEHEFVAMRNFGAAFIAMRAEAILLRRAGWDPVLLFLATPAVAFVVSGAVAAVRELWGGVAIHPDRRGTLNQLFFDMNRAEKRILEFREASDITPEAEDGVERLAEALWRFARAA